MRQMVLSDIQTKKVAYKRFQEKLRLYNLNDNTPHAEQLIVTSNYAICLTGDNPKVSFVSPNRLVTSDIDLAKKWIGIDDELFERYPDAKPHYIFKEELPLALKSELQELRLLSEQQGSTPVLKKQNEILRTYNKQIDLLAKAFIYGYSKQLRNYKQAVFDLLNLEFSYNLWFIKYIEVLPGGVLNIDPNGTVLIADKIIIHKRGKIKSEGDKNQVKIICNSLMKN